MIEQRVTLRYGAQQIPAIVQAVQGDTGRDVIFELADYEIPAGATANYYIDKPDGNAVYNSAEVISSTEILAHLTEQALAAPGRNNGQVRILSDGEVITSFDFVLEVMAFGGILHMQSETEVNIFDQAIEDAVNTATEEAVAEIQAQTPVVTGMQNSIAPTYSASSTYAVGDYVMYNAQLYKCVTAITTAEAWTAEHWIHVPIAHEVSALKSALDKTAISPVLRNGSIGNPDNAYMVSFKLTQPVYKAKGFIISTNIELPDGYDFIWTCSFYNQAGVSSTSASVKDYSGFQRTTKNTIYWEIPEHINAFALALSCRKQDDSEYFALRVADVGNAINVKYHFADYVDSKLSYISPDIIIRNGSLMYPSNTNGITFQKTIPTNGAKGVWLITDYTLDDGYYYIWEANATNDVNQASQSTTNIKEYRPLAQTDSNIFYWKFDVDAKAFSVSLYIKNLSTNQFKPLRYSDMETPIIVVYDYDVSFDNFYAEAEIRNGTLFNASNTNAISFEKTMPTLGAKGVLLSVDAPIPDGYEYYYDGSLYSDINVKTESRDGIFDFRPIVKTSKNTIYWEFNINANAFAVAIYAKSADGTIAYPLRYNHSSIKIMYVYNTDLMTETDVMIRASQHIPNSNVEPLSILHFSDLHKDIKALNRIVKDFENSYNKIDDIICTGDMVENTYEHISGWWNSKVLTCIGNHDTASYSSVTGYDWTALSMADRDAYYIAPFESEWNINHTSGKSYYYKDYSNAKVRLIVMDGMLYTDAGQDATDQTSWLTSLLSNAISTDYHVLIAIHSPSNGAVPFACSFTRYGQTALPNPWDTSCVTQQEVINAVETAKANGLNFAGYIVGHTHQDNIWKPYDTDQFMYCVTTASNRVAQWKNSDLYKSDNDGDAYNVVTIDTAHTLVKIVRGGGANVDDHMRARKAICFNYSTGEKVGEIL